MKMIEFLTVSGTPVSIVPNKLTAVLAKSFPKEKTRIFLIGDTDPFEVMGSYSEVMETIRKC